MALRAMNRRGPLKATDPAGWLLCDNVVALDAVGCHLMDIVPQSVGHLRLAAQEGLGSTQLAAHALSRPLPQPLIHAFLQPTLMDRIAIFLYRSYFLSKLVFDSPATSLLYKLIGRTPPGTVRSAHPHSHAYPAGD
jgi:hypothetical protein